MKWFVICAMGVASGTFALSACSKTQESECLAAWCGNATEPASTEGNGWEPGSAPFDAAVPIGDANSLDAGDAAAAKDAKDVHADSSPTCAALSGESFSSTECKQCASASCCSEVTACYQESTGQCYSATACGLRCTPSDETNCLIACLQGMTDQNARNMAITLSSCVTGKCKTPCGK